MILTPVLRWIWIAGATLGILASAVAGGTLSPAVPVLVGDLQLADLSLLRWIIGAFALAFAVLIVPAAVLGDLIGHARVLLLGAIVLALASVLGATAGSDSGLLFARLGQGAGAALIVPQLVGYARVRLEGVQRAVVCGLFAVAYLAGWVLGPVLGAQLASGDSWRATFWMTVPLALIAAGVAVPAVFEQALGRLDPLLLIVGFAAVPATLGIMLPLLANNGDWSTAYTLVLLVGCVLFAGCLAAEVMRRGIRAGLGAPLLVLLVFGGAASLTTLQLFLQVAVGAPASTAALSGVPLAAGALIGAGIAVPVGLWLSTRAATASGAVVMFVAAAAQLVLLQGAPGTFGWGAVAFGAALHGIGLGLVLSALTRGDGDTAGPIPGALFAAIPLGTAVGVELAQRLTSDVADALLGPGVPQVVEALRGDVAVLLVVSVVLLVAAVGVALFLAPRSDPEANVSG